MYRKECYEKFIMGIQTTLKLIYFDEQILLYFSQYLDSIWPHTVLYGDVCGGSILCPSGVSWKVLWLYDSCENRQTIRLCLPYKPDASYR